MHGSTVGELEYHVVPPHSGAAGGDDYLSNGCAGLGALAMRRCARSAVIGWAVSLALRVAGLACGHTRVKQRGGNVSLHGVRPREGQQRGSAHARA